MAIVRLRSKLYSRCRWDDTDNVALKHIETNNRSIECNDYAVYRNVPKSFWETKKNLGGQCP